jgi:hypothetical protein
MENIDAFNNWLNTNLVPTIKNVNEEIINICPLTQNNICYGLVAGMLYSFYNLILNYPQLLSLIFWLYPTHLTLVEIANFEEDINLKILIVWLGVTVIENFGKILMNYPLMRILVFFNMIKYTEKTNFVDNRILQLLVETHQTINAGLNILLMKSKKLYKNE